VRRPLETSTARPGPSAEPVYWAGLRDFRPLSKGTLIGFAEVELPRWGLTINDVAIHSKNGKFWAQQPAKPRMTGGEVQFENGKIHYTPILGWRDREVSDRFCAVVGEAVRRKHPGTLLV
jgi:hypothetical protein